MAQIRQTDKRTGTVYVYEAEAKWDPERKQTRYGKRRLVGHVDPETGEVVPNRQTRIGVLPGVAARVLRSARCSTRPRRSRAPTRR